MVPVLDVESRFAPVFALKAAGKVFDPDGRILTTTEIRYA